MKSQEPLTIKGAASPSCFFTRLAAFFSFGVSEGRFFASLLDRWGLLGIAFTLLIILKGRPEPWEAELRGVCPDAPISPGLLDAALRIECRRVAAEKIVIRGSWGA